MSWIIAIVFVILATIYEARLEKQEKWRELFLTRVMWVFIGVAAVILVSVALVASFSWWNLLWFIAVAVSLVYIVKELRESYNKMVVEGLVR